MRIAWKIFGWFEDISTILCFVMGMGLMLYEVIMRYIFSNPTTWINEISTSLVVWGVFLGLSLALRDEHHVSADILYAVLPVKLRRLLDYFANTVGIIFCAFFVYYSTSLVYSLLNSRQISIETGLPMWIFVAILPLSGTLFGIRFIERIWITYRSDYKSGGNNNDSVEVEEKCI
ncbi:TRAP transporter small permease [Virgibacillus halophilus]|uniref:TRAP transporter small permease n=1 Tax=Tigheibacillus halophilus TaxID=361280 RepID=UPI0036446668